MKEISELHLERPQIVHHRSWLDETTANELRSLLPKRKGMWQRYRLPDVEVTYSFFNKTKPLMVMNIALAELTKALNESFSLDLNVAVINEYPNGEHGLGMHRDSGIAQLDNKSPIVMVSFGATRAFALIHGSLKKKLQEASRNGLPLPDPHEEIDVANGDVLIMEPKCNKEWLHGVLKDPLVTTSRTSITFRRHKY